MSLSPITKVARFTALLAIVQWTAHFTLAADNQIRSRDVLRFDAGPQNSQLETGALRLSTESEYSTAKGYGWLTAPQESFSRNKLSRSRTALTIDGVSGSAMKLRVDVAPGDWIVTCWIEVDPLEEIQTQFSLQGDVCPPGWQIFAPSAEPRQPEPKIYRVFQAPAVVNSEGLLLNIEGHGSPVRLLALSLIRQSGEIDIEKENFKKKLLEDDQLHGGTDLAELVGLAESHAQTREDDGFFALWHQRLVWLTMAEKYSSMRGWRWADNQTGLGIFDRYHQAVMLLDGFLAGDQDGTQPLADRARSLRARLLAWMHKERGGEKTLESAQRDFELLAKRYPADELIRMYQGDKILTPKECDQQDSTSSAPKWSLAQREALCHMREIVRWWTQHQSETGEFGGKLGDDVELLRWWAPLCLGGDKNALQGWQRLADGVWRSDHIEGGYARKVADVEHASEFIADTAPLMAVYSDSPKYLERLVPSVGYFENLWTGINPLGHRYFRSAWFSSSAIETEDPKNRDVELNTRAARALRYFAWRRTEPSCTQLLHEWSLAWVDAALRTDKGKPRGIVPPSVRFEDGAINGDGPNWYEADMYWSYFDWDHDAGSMILDQLLSTYFLTEDRHLLEPMLLTLDLIKEAEQSTSERESSVGSRDWAAEKLRTCTLFWNVVEQWRFSIDNPRFDDLIMRYGSPYGRYRLTGDEKYLTEGLDVVLQDIRYNFPLKTSEAFFTDRVYVNQWQLLKAMITGDGILNSTSPYFQVSWRETNEHFTALVQQANSSRLDVQLYSHDSEERTVDMQVWQLVPGQYYISQKRKGLPTEERVVEITTRGHTIPMTLPAKHLVSVSLRQIENFQPLKTDKDK